MATINIPRMDVPSPRMPQGRIQTFSGDAQLDRAENEMAGAGLDLLGALVGLGAKLSAQQGQDELNRVLIAYEDAKAQKIAELQNFPKEAQIIPDTDSQDRKPDITRRTDNAQLLKSLPNTEDFRTWRKEYLDNKALPGMKSKQAKEALVNKINADSIEIDAKLADFDYKTSKARLADSYNVRLQQDIAGGNRQNAAVTVLEMQQIGMLNETDKNNMLDSTFAVIKSNEVLNAALQASFAKSGYGDDKAGKAILEGNKTFVDHKGAEREYDTADAKKRFDAAFKDQRQAFTTQMDEQYARSEDQAVQLYTAGTLSNAWVEKTFKDIPGTSGRSRQQYWLGQVKSLNNGTSGKGSPMITDVLNLVQNPFMDKSVKQEKLLQMASKNPDGMTPDDMKYYSGLIEDAQKRIDPSVMSTLNIFNEAKTKAEAIAKKKPKEGNTQLQKLYEIERSTLRSLADIGNETDVVKRDQKVKKLQDDLVKITSNLKILNLYEGTSQEVGDKVVIAESSGGRYDIKYDEKLSQMKNAYSDVIASSSEGKNVIKQVTEYENKVLQSIFPDISSSEMVRGTDGKFGHVISATKIKAANAKVIGGNTVVRFDKDEKGNNVLQYLTNSKDVNNNPVFQTYKIAPNRSNIQSNMESIDATQNVFDKLYGGF